MVSKADFDGEFIERASGPEKRTARFNCTNAGAIAQTKDRIAHAATIPLPIVYDGAMNETPKKQIGLAIPTLCALVGAVVSFLTIEQSTQDPYALFVGSALGMFGGLLIGIYMRTVR
jgi:hypothetical protein